MEIGKICVLEILRFKKVGAFLNSNPPEGDDILLPKKYLKKDWAVGSEVKVFIYKDSSDRPVATTEKPLLEVGRMGFLKVADKTKIGYFLDIGLERDVLLPFSESIGKIDIGRKVFVYLYVDKSERLAATMKVKGKLLPNELYKENDEVFGVIYSIHPEYGAFVAVNNKYDALLPNDEMFGIFEVGDELGFRVSQVREDGKIKLTLRERKNIQMSKDQEKIWAALERAGGVLSIGDKSEPKLIKDKLQMSKSDFKRAIGGLYKQRLIVPGDFEIKRTESGGFNVKGN